jgi:NAD(P)-dependent dehydrogenase (short-subunit alcohol dehydrogenase family)
MATSEEAHVALITGAGGGIGAAVARGAFARGAKVALADRDVVSARRVADELDRRGGGARAYEVDVGDSDAPAALVERVEAECGPITALVNAAGVIQSVELLAVRPADWDREMSINARGAFFLLQAVARSCVERGAAGSIVNLASIAGRSGRPLNSVYSASKAAVISFTKSAARALAPHGVRVNAVAPGVVDTPMTTALHEQRGSLIGLTAQQSLDRMAGTIPLGRIASPDEVARVILFLAFDAGYVTGQCVNVCGGLEMD